MRKFQEVVQDVLGEQDIKTEVQSRCGLPTMFAMKTALTSTCPTHGIRDDT